MYVGRGGWLWGGGLKLNPKKSHYESTGGPDDIWKIWIIKEIVSPNVFPDWYLLCRRPTSTTRRFHVLEGRVGEPRGRQDAMARPGWLWRARRRVIGWLWRAWRR